MSEHRRDFLKVSSLSIAPLFLPKIPLQKDLIDPESKKFPRLEIESLPTWVRQVWRQKPDLYLADSGRVNLVGQENNYEQHPIPLEQTFITKRNKDLYYRGEYSSSQFIRTEDPKGIVLHWFGDSENWTKSNAPNMTAKEYIDAGFGTATSAAFLVGSEHVTPNLGLDDKVAIVQAELPLPDGKWSESAHALFKDPQTDGKNPNQYLIVTGDLTTKYGILPRVETNNKYWGTRLGTHLQVMAKENIDSGFENQLNTQTLGIEILGIDFFRREDSPEIVQTANVLGLLMTLGRKYGISGTDILGHHEVDLSRGDPGVEFLFKMRLLYGLAPLINGDVSFAHDVYKPFLDAKFKVYALVDYFDYMEEMFDRTKTGRDGTKEEIIRFKNGLGIEKIKREIYRSGLLDFDLS